MSSTASAEQLERDEMKEVAGFPRFRAQARLIRPRLFSVVHLLCVEIHRAARRHGVTDRAIEHAYEQAVVWVELGDDPPRYLVVGPDRSGNLLELVVIQAGGIELVIHAMPLRPSTQREVFGDER